MNHTPQLLLIGTVAAIGVLHTMVPDHWMPIILLARQHGWSRRETALAALQAGLGHVLSTLLIALAVALAGVAFAARFGHLVDSAASLALIGLGGWIAIGALRELREHSGNQPGDLPHPHPHGPRHLAAAHLEAYDDDPPMRDRLYMPLAGGLAGPGARIDLAHHGQHFLGLQQRIEIAHVQAEALATILESTADKKFILFEFHQLRLR